MQNIPLGKRQLTRESIVTSKKEKYIFLSKIFKMADQDRIDLWVENCQVYNSNVHLQISGRYLPSLALNNERFAIIVLSKGKHGRGHKKL